MVGPVRPGVHRCYNRKCESPLQSVQPMTVGRGMTMADADNQRAPANPTGGPVPVVLVGRHEPTLRRALSWLPSANEGLGRSGARADGQNRRCHRPPLPPRRPSLTDMMLPRQSTASSGCAHGPARRYAEGCRVLFGTRQGLRFRTGITGPYRTGPAYDYVPTRPFPAWNRWCPACAGPDAPGLAHSAPMRPRSRSWWVATLMSLGRGQPL